MRGRSLSGWRLTGGCVNAKLREGVRAGAEPVGGFADALRGEGKGPREWGRRRVPPRLQSVVPEPSHRERPGGGGARRAGRDRDRSAPGCPLRRGGVGAAPGPRPEVPQPRSAVAEFGCVRGVLGRFGRARSLGATRARSAGSVLFPASRHQWTAISVAVGVCERSRGERRSSTGVESDRCPLWDRRDSVV